MYATSADWKVNDGTWSTDQEKTMTAKLYGPTKKLLTQD